MKITLLNDFEARIASAVVAAVQQVILEAKIATAVEQALCSHSHSFYSPAFKPASEPAVKPAAELVHKPVYEPAFKSVSEPASEFTVKSFYKPVFESAAEPAKQKKQLQLFASKQSLLIVIRFIILIQSCSSYHLSYSCRSFYF